MLLAAVAWPAAFPLGSTPGLRCGDAGEYSLAPLGSFRSVVPDVL